MAEEYLSDQEIKRRNTTHRIKVHSLQLGFAVLLMGTWQILADKKILDPFFYGRPTGVLHQLKVWVQNGTSIGSLWVNAWVTFYEATYGFFAGVILGIIFGVFLARNKTAAEIFAPYIKVSNSIPRVVLGSIFVLWLGLGSISKVALAFVLVFFPVFFNAF